MGNCFWDGFEVDFHNTSLAENCSSFLIIDFKFVFSFTFFYKIIIDFSGRETPRRTSTSELKGGKKNFIFTFSEKTETQNLVKISQNWSKIRQKLIEID